jgi:hypothetical protein
VRKAQSIVIAAGGRWPDAGGGFGVRFNWVKIDNRGSGTVDVGLGGMPTAGDKVDTVMTVKNGTVRVFNVAGPRSAEGPGEDWPDQITLVSASGTTVRLEVADHPIVDLVLST